MVTNPDPSCPRQFPTGVFRFGSRPATNLLSFISFLFHFLYHFIIFNFSFDFDFDFKFPLFTLVDVHTVLKPPVVAYTNTNLLNLCYEQCLI